MKEKDILKIYKSKSTVFTASELSLILSQPNADNLKRKLNYFVKKGYLLNLRRGIYAKDKDYSQFEFANKIYTPSYVSLDTILAQNGVIFQYDSRVYLVSYLSREIYTKDNNFVYQKIKDFVLYNKEGIIQKDNYYTATLERAFLDKIYLNPNFYFDNLKNINWKKTFDLAKIYNNKSLIRNLNIYYQNAK